MKSDKNGHSELYKLLKNAYNLNMESKLRFKKCILLCLFLGLTGIIYFGYFCSENVCALTFDRGKLPKWSVHVDDSEDKVFALYSNRISDKVTGLSYDDIFNGNFHFDINANDVMVFLHIQKTGGTSFGRHLVQDLDLQRPCTCQRKHKRCYCFRPNRNENWLFSRYSTGWKCGLHADWTELTNCVDAELDKNEGEPAKRRYLTLILCLGFDPMWVCYEFLFSTN